MAAYVQSTDSFSALIFGGANDSWTVLAGRKVAVSANTAVSSTQSNSTLVNHGTLFSGNGSAAHFQSVNATIVNKAGGKMTGYAFGIYFFGFGATVNNAGYIESISLTGINLSSTGGYNLRNTGTVIGQLHGAFVYGSTGGTVYNDGKMTGLNALGYGLTGSSGVGSTTTLTNDTHGVIKGGLGGIYWSDAPLSIVNNGKIVNGLLLLGEGQDKVVNKGSITGDSLLGGGNDVFKGGSGSQARVFGEGGDDRIIGGAKGETISGGLGKDTLTGGGGKDTFLFNAITESTVGANRDFITDFSRAQGDRINLKAIDADQIAPNDQAFAFIGTKAFTGAGQLRYVLHDKPGTANDTTTIYGNVNADLAPDFQIEVKGLVKFVAGDFVL